MPTIKFARGQGAASALLDYVQGKQQEAIEQGKARREFQQKLIVAALEHGQLTYNRATGDVEPVPERPIPKSSELGVGEKRMFRTPTGEITVSGPPEPKQLTPTEQLLLGSKVKTEVARQQRLRQQMAQAAQSRWTQLFGGTPVPPPPPSKPGGVLHRDKYGKRAYVYPDRSVEEVDE